MDLLFILNISFLLFINVYKMYYLSSFFKFRLVNPFSILFLTDFPILLFTVIFGPMVSFSDGLFDEYYNFAILMTNISETINLIILYLVLNYLNKRPYLHSFLNKKFINLQLINLKFLSLFFMFLSFLCFVLLTTNFGFVNWIKDPRIGYQYYRYGAGHYYALSISFLSLSYALIMISVKKNLSVGIYAVTYSILIYFFGSKNLLLAFGQFALIILWLKKFKYLSLTIVVFVPLTFLVMLVNFYSTISEADLLSIFSYFDYYKNSAMYYKAYFLNEIDPFYGEVFSTKYWRLVPRELYPDKPYVYGFLHVNEWFFPGMAEMTHTPAFGGPIESFADFGILGVIIFSLFDPNTVIQATLYYFMYKNLDINEIRSNSKKLYLYIWIWAPAFLIYIGFPLNLLFFFICIVIINTVNRIKIKG